MQAEKQHVKHLPFHRKQGFWYLRKRILERSWGTYSLPEKYIRGGKHAITMAKSDLSGNYINLQVNYYIKIPISFLR